MKNMTLRCLLLSGAIGLGCGGAQAPVSDQSKQPEEQPMEQAAEPDAAKAEEPDQSETRSGEEKAPEETKAASAAEADSSDTEEGAGKCNESSGQLSLTVDRATVNLDQGRLEASMDGPVCKVVLTITRKSGLPVVKTFRYDGPRRELRWAPVPRDEIEKVEIRGYAENNAYTGVKMVPWSVTIEHKEVEFDTDKAIIRNSELPSLEDSLKKINRALDIVKGKELGTITLFIAGHTDTRGSQEHNQELSRRRAQAIASWFTKRGLCIPVAFEGFGENALKKKTADEVDEQENRRVDYILAVEPPMTKKGVTPAWKWVSKGC